MGRFVSLRCHRWANRPLGKRIGSETAFHRNYFNP